MSDIDWPAWIRSLPCIDKLCDGSGTVCHGYDPDTDDYDISPCQFCDEREKLATLVEAKFPRLDAAESLIERLQSQVSKAEFAMMLCSGSCGHSYRAPAEAEQRPHTNTDDCWCRELPCNRDNVWCDSPEDDDRDARLAELQFPYIAMGVCQIHGEWTEKNPPNKNGCPKCRVVEIPFPDAD